MNVVYFLGPDKAAAMAPPPGDVRVKVIPPEGEPSELALKAEPKGADTARFASPPGRYDYDELRGEVTATVGGGSVTTPFAMR